MLDKEANKEQIMYSLKKLLLNPYLCKDDIVLFYFAGHGGLDDALNMFLVAEDTEFNPGVVPPIDISTCVHIKELEVCLDNTKAGTVIFIVDACFSGSMGKALGRIKYNSQTNTVFVGACNSNQSSAELSSLHHGLFTSCFLEGLILKPSLGEWISLNQLLSSIEKRMKEFSFQTIEISSHVINPNIPIARNPLYRVSSNDFTKEIIDIFELAGARTQTNLSPQNFFIANQKGLAINRVGVLCLENNELEITENDVDQFIALIKNSRQMKQIDRGFLITSLGINPNLISRIHQSGITETKTKEELLRSIMDFGVYLKRLIAQFEDRDIDVLQQPPLLKFYVDLLGYERGFSKHPVLLIDIVKKWLQSEGKRVAILGEYGSGKTAFCKKLSCEMAKIYGENGQSRIPILINLSKFPRIEADIEAIIINHLSRTCNIANPSWEAFRRINDAGFLLLIFDGLDEMAVRTSRDVVETNLLELEKLANSTKSKVILTCRPEYFWSSGEEEELFTNQKRINIAPFTPIQIKTFLQKRIPLVDNVKHDWMYYYSRIKGSLFDLSKRPVFLEMMAETLPQLIEENEVINRNSLYKKYIMNELRRQKVENKRKLLLEANMRLELMRLMAFELFNKNLDGLNSQEVLDLVRPHLNKEQITQLEGSVSDFLTCSFLIRTVDKFSFSHRTFMEFLVSDVLYDSIKQGDPSHFQELDLSEPMLDFLSEREIDSTILLDWIRNKKNSSTVNAVSHLDGNCISLLSRLNCALINIDLSNTQINDAKLSRINLSEVNLKGSRCNNLFLHASKLKQADLTGATLKNSDLSNVDLSEATLCRTNIKLTNFDSAKLIKTDLSFSFIIDCTFEGSTLNEVDFSGCVIKSTNLRSAKLVHANLSGASFKDVDLSESELTYVDIRDTNLDANLDGTDLSGAIFNEKTKINIFNLGADIDDIRDMGHIDEDLYLYLKDQQEREVNKNSYEPVYIDPESGKSDEEKD